jgi:hypothetical protein
VESCKCFRIESIESSERDPGWPSQRSSLGFVDWGRSERIEIITSPYSLSNVFISDYLTKKVGIVISSKLWSSVMTNDSLRWSTSSLTNKAIAPASYALRAFVTKVHPPLFTSKI